ncbi:MAG: class I SAM-dependent methyltransferase [Candidatus Pacebacteria bacterium]|jgi:2-polyprenyl-3-methyl-5-hydroxy-6-metoxy-1,4-benzoquinol methylase|nr:class I SAM-dependent methyltransferase [Candidatus Paceibacterota bacterium]MDP7466520.1 class I SAM-dependent methyltransferase [Candidatus Paceibacterota bacterium]|tara:strand:+ start:2028 stop:2723 length:696 start_codon:yes stop_codon:yes gene_type:complete
MKYLESEKIKEKPELYIGVKQSLSWILKEPFIFDYFNKFIKKNSNILEIGCGRGYFLDKLDKAGFQNLQGADLANYLENKKYKHQALDLNVEKLNFKAGELDVIAAFQIIEHLENYFLVIQEASRILKKDGMFIFSVPNQFNIFYRIKFALTGNMSGWTLENNHLLFTTRDVFKKTYLKDFDLVETYYSKGPVPMLGRLNFIPGVNFPAKNRILPRSEAFSDRVCFFLKKK